MSTATLPAVRPAAPLDVLALQWANPARILGVPAAILGAVIAFSIIVSLAILRAGGSLSGSGFNSGLVWSLSGYMVAIGVQNVTSTFPFALALGSTRRSFVLGNLLTTATISAFVTACAMALLGLEEATGGWFIGTHVLRVDTLANGNPVGLAVTFVLGVATAISVGGLFGASWTRFGPLGPTAIAIGTGLVVAVGLLLFLPQLGTLLRGFEPWWLAVVAVVLTLVSTFGQYPLLRRASVR